VDALEDCGLLARPHRNKHLALYERPRIVGMRDILLGAKTALLGWPNHPQKNHPQKWNGS
jgi:hypothetical protein